MSSDEKVTHAAIDRPSGDSSEGGSLSILKMLVEWDYPLKYDACSTPAYYGDIEMLQYLVSVGCRLDHEVISMAASAGHLHIIIWAREQGCPWNADACNETIEYYHINVLKWLRGFDRDTCELTSDETEICPWDDKLGMNAIRDGRLDLLEFALDNSYEFSEKARVDALQKKAMRDYYLG